MALGETSYKSVGLILAIALVGVVIVIATVGLRNKQKVGTASSTKPFIEPISGVVFDGPQDWTVGSASTNTIETHTYRLADIPSQQSTCVTLSPTLSQSLDKSLASGATEAATTWEKEFPGLVTSQVLRGPSTIYALIGIDTCNPSLTVRSIVFRGQVYKNSVEVQLSHTVAEDSQLSPTDLNQLAQSLADGTASADLQLLFNQFVAALGSVR